MERGGVFILKIDDDRAVQFEVCSESFLRSAQAHQARYIPSKPDVSHPDRCSSRGRLGSAHEFARPVFRGPAHGEFKQENHVELPVPLFFADLLAAPQGLDIELAVLLALLLQGQERRDKHGEAILLSFQGDYD